ncbi:hypothetical protein BBD41_13045 [Paenibacillus ihbetae]|uniref:DUF4179 domain-containing protein n=1 Tax=Paenibacillus ihbetae TaxID=1870820 RepID=A0A1B2E0A3_9BACL|nr:hypothetical protein BBD41_13045 [Paenibacillus ihbetae]
MKLKSNEEDPMWEHMLFSQGTDTDFTQKVMQSLEEVEMDYSKQGSHQRWKRAKQRRRMITAAAAVSLIVMGSSLLAWKQPDLIRQVSSIFSLQPQTIEESLPPELKAWTEMSDLSWLEDYKKSKPLGLVQTPKIKVEDKGYSFEIVNVMVDSSRIVITAKQTGPDGKELQSPLEDGGLQVTDLEGNVIASLARGINMMDGLEEYVFIFDQTVPDRILVTGNPEYIRESVDNQETGRFERKQVEVDWDFRFQIDMKKAKQFEHRDILDAKYTTPEGLVVSMEQMIRTPNGIRLDMGFKLKDMLASKATADWGDDLHIWYHLETDQPQKILRFGDGIGRHSVKIQGLPTVNEDNGTLPWSETWYTGTVPPETKNIRFVLDGYSLPVKDEAAVHINMEKLEQTPVVFEHEGDQITITGSSMEKDAVKSNGNVLRLHAKGRYTNNVTRDQWIALDSNGEEYPVEIEGSGSANEDGTAEWIMDFVVAGVDPNLSELTLKRTVVDKRFTDVNWAVDLPSYTSLPWESLAENK